MNLMVHTMEVCLDDMNFHFRANLTEMVIGNMVESIRKSFDRLFTNLS